MNIGSISSTGYMQQTSRVGSSSQMEGMPKPPDESRQGKDGGGFLGAIDSALKEAGISDGLSSLFGGSSTSETASTSESDSNSTTSTSSTEDARAALDAFMQNLMAALQSQSDASSTTTSDSESDTAMSGLPPPPPPPNGYGGEEGMSDKLQSLISELTSSDSSSTDTSDSESSDLESSFASLMSALGGDSSSSSADLQSFLESLASNLQGRGTSGTVVSTEA